MLMKRESQGVAGWEQAEKTVWHSIVREQRSSSSLQIETDEEITILPYAYFQEARCRKKDRTWEIMLYWPWVIVSVKGRNMEDLPRLIAEHGLALLEFHPQGERVNRDDRPELESVTLIPRSEEPVLPPPVGAQSPAGSNTAYRSSYSVG
jgi:hypothetical protein